MPDKSVTPGQFRDVVICEFYSFNAGVFDKSLHESLLNRLDNRTDIWVEKFCGTSQNIESGHADDMNLLRELFKFEEKYVYPEFRNLRRCTRYLLPGFALKYHDPTLGLPQDLKVDVVLSLHRSGVATLMFLAKGLNLCSDEGLKLLVNFHMTGHLVDYSDRLRALLADHPPLASLDRLFSAYLDVLHPSLVDINRIDCSARSGNVLAESMVNQYEFISIDGVGNDVDAFVEQNRQTLIDTVEAYSYFTKPGFSFAASRKADVLKGFFTPGSSVRRHLTYQMNAYRIVAVSAIKAHPDIYDYGPAPWYASYLGMIELVLGQFEVVYLLHGELWKQLGSKADILKLQESSYESLLDFLNARVIDHPRGVKFISRLAGVLRIQEYYDVVKERLEMADTIASEHHSKFERVNTRRFQFVGFLVSLVLLLQFSNTFYRELLWPSVHCRETVLKLPGSVGLTLPEGMELAPPPGAEIAVPGTGFLGPGKMMTLDHGQELFLPDGAKLIVPGNTEFTLPGGTQIATDAKRVEILGEVRLMFYPVVSVVGIWVVTMMAFYAVFKRLGRAE